VIRLCHIILVLFFWFNHDMCLMALVILRVYICFLSVRRSGILEWHTNRRTLYLTIHFLKKVNSKSVYK